MTFRCNKEAIIATGAFETSKLLLLSGISQAEKLAPHGVEIEVGSFHEGRKVLDHPIMPHAFK
jgi:choline dehydrogenase-like flavoprotein